MKSFKINPIVKKDIRVSSRSSKLSLGLLVFEAILTVTLFLIFGSMDRWSDYSYENIYSYTVAIFPTLAGIQLAIICFIIPIISSSSISGEIERQTFDIMLTTSLSPFNIVVGKVLSSMLRVLLYIVASIPILSLSFIVGGTSWFTLLLYILFVMFISFFVSCIGVYCSAKSKRSINAVIHSFVIYLILGLGTFLPLLISEMTDNGEIGCIALLFNPFVLCEEFINLSVTNEGLFNSLSGSPLAHYTNSALLDLLTTGLNWFIVSTIIFIGMSFMFIKLTIKKINPLNEKNEKKYKKGKGKKLH